VSAPVRARAVTAPDPTEPAGLPRRKVPWIATVGAGTTVLLAGAPVSTTVQGGSWFGDAVLVVAAVVGTGLLLYRVGPAVAAAGQSVAVLLVLTALFTDDAILGLLPGPATFGQFGVLVAGAGEQIDVGIAPVPATPEILFLITAAFGLLTVSVHLAAVGARAPAAAGIPLLAVFAVPAALADDLLPWWALVAAAAGFGLLLIARDGVRRQWPAAAAVVVAAVVVALGFGAVTGFVGTSGRFDGGAGAGGGGGSIGLSPFTSLRGQLDQSASEELFRVRDLPRATYLRALTLSTYVPAEGWQASRPDPGSPLPGPLEPGSTVPGDVVDVRIENVSFRDYWLPLYGVPLDVSDVTTEWAYDSNSGTAYSTRPREEDDWRQRALITAPSVQQLREADGPEGARAAYLAVDGVDPRVSELTAGVVADRDNAFDRAVALQDFFTGSDSPFAYSLQTAPGAGDDALVEFLTVGRTGYCEQYASAMAVMLRTVGVPARVAVGFTGGTDTGDYRSISTSDAHAWVEAWFPGVGWTTFDPTPLTDGRAITPPYIVDARGEATPSEGSVIEDERGAGAAPTPQPSAAPATPEVVEPSATTGSADQAGGVALWPVAVVAVVALLALLPRGLRARGGRRRLAAVAAGGPDAAGAGWAELLAESADRGAPPRPTDTVRATARRLVRDHRLDDDAQQALRIVVGAVESSWYGAGHADAQELTGPVRQVRAAIAAGSSLTIRDRLFPRSVFGTLRTRKANHVPDLADAQATASTDRAAAGR